MNAALITVVLGLAQANCLNPFTIAAQPYSLGAPHDDDQTKPAHGASRDRPPVGGEKQSTRSKMKPETGTDT